MALRLRLQSARQKIRPRSWASTTAEGTQTSDVVSISVAEDENCPPTIGRASLELPALPKSPSIIITKPDNSTCRPKTDSVSSTAPTASGKKNSSWRRRIGHRKSKSLSENISLPLDQVNDSGIQPQSDDVSDTETLVGDEGLDNQLVCAPVVRQPSPCASIFPPFYPTEKQLPAPPSPSATVDDSPRPDSNSSASSGVFQRTIQFRLPEESHRRLSNKVKNRNLLTIEISSHDPSRRTSPRKYVKTPLPRSPLSPARRAITSRTLRAQTLIPASQLRALEKHLEAELPLTPATSSGDSDCLRELIDRLGHYSGSSHHQSDSESIAESTISDRLFEDRLLNCIRPLPPKYRRQPSASGLSPIQASPRSPHRSSAQHPRQTQGRNRTQPARAPRRVGSWPSLKSPGFHSKSRSSSRSTITDQAGTPSDVESTFEERLKDVYRSALRPGRLSTKSSLDTFTPVSPVPPFKLTKTLLQRQNLFPPEQVRLLHTLLQREHPHSPIVSSPLRSAPHSLFSTISPRTAAFGAAKGMGHRKVWVKRAGGSATTIVVRDSDLVDDVRDMVLTKYGNSLGRTFDAPDINIRVVPRAGAANRPNGVERLLGPDEAINEILDTYFKDGQSMEEALVIELPPRKTPKASPRNTPGAFYPEEHPMHLTHPHHREYFPPTGLLVHNAADAIVSSNVPLNSPGRYRRPKPSRRQTQSPVSAHSSKQVDEKNVESSDSPEPPPNPVLPPATDFQLARPNRLNTRATHVKVASKSNSIATSPHIMRPTTENLSSGVDRQGNKIYSTLPAQTNKPVRSDTLILEHSGVPPINVLLVEDNMINLRLLEAFMKRLKVRYKTAIDGEQAISRWKEGGFHLVLMDIQLPKINGLEATRMIRNLETESGIGLGASLRALSNSETEGLRDMESLEGQTGDGNGEIKIMTAASDAGDSTASLGQTMKQVGTTNFKSPVIIVALTASSLESDRHDALAAGCNDFLTKPVNYMYLERKVMEWGCMQALIDFDGWRQWKIDAAIAEEAMIKENKARQEARAIARASKLNGGGGSSNAYLSGSGSRPSMRRRELGNREGGLARGKSRDVSAVGKKFGDKSGPDSQTEDSGQTTEAPFKPPITSSDSNDSTTGFIASVVESEPEQYPQRQPDLQDEVPNQEPQTRSQGKHKRPPSLNLYPGGSAASGTSIHGSQRLSQTLHVRHDLASPLGRTLSNNEGPGEGSGAEDEETPLGSTRATVDGKLKRSSESGAEVVADGEMLPLGLLNGGVDVRGKRWKGEREGPELG